MILEQDFNLEIISKHIKKYPLKDNSKKVYDSLQIAEFNEYAAKRVALNDSFDFKKINKIPYAKEGKSPIAELLKKHLSDNNNEPKLAFSGEGLENLTKRNNGNPITKITIYEKKSIEDKFNGKYVEIDAGANVYFIMYENTHTGIREKMYSLAAHKAIERLVAGKKIADYKEGYKTIIISPNDLVYMPTEAERQNPELIDFETKDLKKRQEIFGRIYKMVSCSDKECHFIPHYISKSIIEKDELGSNEKAEKAWDGLIQYLPDSKGKLSRKNTGSMIKDHFIKLKIDRLGNFSKATT